MREYRFRGRAIATGEWVEGFYTLVNNNHGMKPAIITGTEKGCFIPEFVDPSTVGQFTGLYDGTKWEQLSRREQSKWLESHKQEEWNGKRIWEGDIISVPFTIVADIICGTSRYETIQEFSEVKWGGDYFSVVIDGDIWMLSEFSDTCEVIGNIHDNPELLKEGD